MATDSANAADKPRFVVVGGGLAGLMAVIKIAEAGFDCDVFSFVPCRRSHSVCAQGGINGAVNTKGEGDSPEIHFLDSVRGGDFLAHQPPVKAMCQAAPGIIYLLDRMGVPFSRTAEGLVDFRRFGGTLYNRTAFAGATTGQQLLYALDEQVRRFETVEVENDNGVTVRGEKMVRKWELWDFLGLVLDERNIARGIVAQDLKSMEIQSFPGEAVCLATGGPGIIYGKSTNSVINTGTAASAVYQQGACYANGEFIQVHPTAIPGADKLRLISESVRGEGGRIWVPKDAKEKRRGKDVPESQRDYFLENKYPGYGNLVPRDIAARELFLKGFHEGKGVFNNKSGKNELEVYLDVTHLPKEILQKKLSGVLEIYEKFIGEDPYTNPMRIFPAVHYSMGGLWVDFEKSADGRLVVGSPRNQATNIGGLYAAGEVDYAYHGANRLGANSLLSCIYGGMVAGPAIASYVKNLDKSAFDVKSSVFDKAAQRERDRYEAILKTSGKENPYLIHEELAQVMLRDCTIERHNDVLDKAIAKIDELEERSLDIGVTDTSARANQGAQFVRHLKNMLVLARVIAQGARDRDESRGAHFKPDFKTRDDANFLRTTMALYRGPREGEKGTSAINYVRGLEYPLLGKTVKITDHVDISLVKPRARKYETAGAASHAAGDAGPKSQSTRAKVSTPPTGA